MYTCIYRSKTATAYCIMLVTVLHVLFIMFYFAFASVVLSLLRLFVFDACKYSCVHVFYLLSYTTTGVLKHSTENAGTPIIVSSGTIYSIAILIIFCYNNRRHLACTCRPWVCSSTTNLTLIGKRGSVGSSHIQNLPQNMIFGHRKLT